MKDFAARAMMKVIAAGARSQNLSVTTMEDDNMQHVANATVPLANKRDVLHLIQQEYGLQGILQLGQGIHQVDDEPMKMVFLNATSVGDFFQRWQRMQKFVHSRHRLECQQVSNNRFELRHVSLADTPPQCAETCLVMSVVMSLLNQCLGQQLHLEHQSHGVNYDGKNWTLTTEPPPESAWLLRIETVPGTDEFTEKQQPPDNDLPPYNQLPHEYDLPPEQLVGRLRSLFRGDPCFKWTLKEAADKLYKSPRTLQRLLTAKLTSFTRLLVNERVLLASELLVDSNASLTEIGFVAGFNSSSHFTTLFRRSTGMSPGQFRKISVTCN